MNTSLPLCLLAALSLTTLAGLTADASETRTAEEQAALETVGMRIAAYNAHEIDSFLLAHAEDVQIYEYPEKRLGQGRSHLRRIFEPQFAKGLGTVKVREQIALGNRVVSHEFVTVDKATEHLITIYTVNDGVITSFRLIEVDD